MDKTLALFIIFFIPLFYVQSLSFLNKNNLPTAELHYIRKCPVSELRHHTLDITFGVVVANVPGVNMTWVALEQFDDRYSADFKMFKWGDGGWKNTIDVRRDKGCTTIFRTFGDILKLACKKADIDCNCPIKKGNYSLQNFAVPAVIGLGPLLAWPGRFYIIVQILLAKEVQTCYEIEFEIRELVSLGNGQFSPSV